MIANGQEWQPGEAIFDHCDLTNMKVWSNHSRYPSLDMTTDFTKEQFAGAYKSFYEFASRYYGIDNLLSGSAVSSPTLKSLPIHVFDVSKQRDRLYFFLSDHFRRVGAWQGKLAKTPDGQGEGGGGGGGREWKAVLRNAESPLYILL